jgi:hypothetical protein
MDQLPAFMKLLNSSEEPSENRSNLITWTILDLAPGESRSIVYRAMAETDGVYVNVAHIEAFSVDGPDGAAADVESRVDMPCEEHCLRPYPQTGSRPRASVSNAAAKSVVMTGYHATPVQLVNLGTR